MNQQQHQMFDDFLQIGIGIDFDNLMAHCEFVRDNLNGEEQRFEDFTNKATAGLSEEQKSAFYEWNEQEAWHIYDVFPSLQWMSTFLLAYGIFEKTLNEISQLAYRTSCPALALNDMKGQGIERAKTYLSKVCGVTIPFNTPEWQKVVALAKIRNVIAHTSGDLDLDKKMHKEAFEIATKDSSIKVTNHDQVLKVASIQLTAEYVIRAIETFRSFLYSVCPANAGKSLNKSD